ncbi:DUF6192 family protein [Streptomyces sp. NPDC097640]|uniref:DUF6192 family protein n=1 Tax=Streptomyces sp. NPDC097640 TaxID=3157229 RepID=UPI00331DD81D
MRSWPELRREGRKLAKRQTDAQFMLGDLLLDLTARLDTPPAHQAALGHFADALNISRDTLNRYCRVSAAWPQAKRNKDVSWTVHAILASHPRRFDLIKHPPPPREKQWTCTEARAVMDSQRQVGEPSA